VYDRLSEVLGRENIFFDVSNIEPGEDFVSRISEIVATCDVLVAIIGPHWVSITDASGIRRIDSPFDLIHIEVGAALERNIRVIPMLVDGAAMPEEHQLPPRLAPLVRRNAHDVSFNHFHADLDSFIRVLQRVLKTRVSSSQQESHQVGSQARDIHSVATELPFTISIETLGSFATPLIQKGTKLPAEASEIFSTAADNQTSVEISLFIGELSSAKDNVHIGKFRLSAISPAPRGIPQIRIKTLVDSALMLTITAEDLNSHTSEVLDAVDLARIEVPRKLVMDGMEVPKRSESDRDSPVNLDQATHGASATSSSKFSELLNQLFGTVSKTSNPTGQSQNTSLELTVSASEASTGVVRTIDLGGRNIQIRIPPGGRNGQLLRIPGVIGADGKQHDLYVRYRVK
jgi:hypothetical protein